MMDIIGYLIIATSLFFIGLIGMIYNRSNFISLLMCLELILLAINMNLVAFSQLHQDISGQAYVFFNLTVAAAESAIGLGLLICLFRQNAKNIDSDQLTQLKG